MKLIWGGYPQLLGRYLMSFHQARGSCWPEPCPPLLPTPCASQRPRVPWLAGRSLREFLGEQSGFPHRWGRAVLGRPPDLRVTLPWQTAHSSGPGPGAAASLAQCDTEPAQALGPAEEGQGHRSPLGDGTRWGLLQVQPAVESKGSFLALLLPPSIPAACSSRIASARTSEPALARWWTERRGYGDPVPSPVPPQEWPLLSPFTNEETAAQEAPRGTWRSVQDNIVSGDGLRTILCPVLSCCLSEGSRKPCSDIH